MLLTALSTDSRPLTPGGFRSQWRVALVVLVALVATAGPADAQGPRARLSRDLTTQLAQPADATRSLDVIVSGNAEFVERLARRHGASVKKGWLSSEYHCPPRSVRSPSSSA